jgi:hypothetical protein
MGERPVLGLIVGNRGGFPQTPVAEGTDLLDRIEALGIDVVTLTRRHALGGGGDAEEAAPGCSGAGGRITVLISLPNLATSKVAD